MAMGDCAFSSAGRNTQIIKVIKSDKSESSVASQMDITPSDYYDKNMK